MKFRKKFCTLVNVNNPKREQKSAAFAVGYFSGNWKVCSVIFG